MAPSAGLVAQVHARSGSGQCCASLPTATTESTSRPHHYWMLRNHPRSPATKHTAHPSCERAASSLVLRPPSGTRGSNAATAVPQRGTRNSTTSSIDSRDPYRTTAPSAVPSSFRRDDLGGGARGRWRQEAESLSFADIVEARVPYRTSSTTRYSYGTVLQVYYIYRGILNTGPLR